MTFFLLILQIILAFLLIILVLLQKNNSEGWSGLANSSSASGTGIVSARASANFLSKSTAIIAFLFMANSLFLAVLVANKNQAPSIIEKSISSESDKKSDSSVPIAE